MRVIIAGAGAHGQVVADIIASGAGKCGSIIALGYVDDARVKPTGDLPILGTPAMLAEIPHEGVVVAVGDNGARKRLFETLARQGENLISVTHASSILSPSAAVGEGTMIGAGAIVNPYASIGDNVILNTGATVDHHSVIGNHVHIAPGSHLGGDVSVGEGALIGIGVSVLPGVRIGAWAVIGAGAAVISDIGPGEIAVGVPAKPR